MNWIISQQVDGYLAAALCIGIFIGAIIFSWLSENRIKSRVEDWAMNNLNEKKEEELMEFIK